MSNMRLIISNLADDAVATATTSAGVMLPANLQANEKSLVWRSTSTTATVTLTYAAAVTVDSVILGWVNFTAAAVVTIKLFTLAGDVVAVETLVISPDAAAYSNAVVIAGLANNVQGYFTASHSIEKITILIADAANAAGYVEMGRVVAGLKYEMVRNPGSGLELVFVDKSKISRAESTDIRLESGSKFRRMRCDFAYLDEADITKLLSVNKGELVYISILPEDTTSRKHVYNMCAARVEDYAERIAIYRSTSITFEEI